MTVQGSVKKQQPDGMSHRGAMAGCRVTHTHCAPVPLSTGHEAAMKWLACAEQSSSDSVFAMLTPVSNLTELCCRCPEKLREPLAVLSDPTTQNKKPSAVQWHSELYHTNANPICKRTGCLGGAPCAVRTLCEKSAVFYHR